MFGMYVSSYLINSNYVHVMHIYSTTVFIFTGPLAVDVAVGYVE